MCNTYLTIGVGEFSSHFRLGVQIESRFGSGNFAGSTPDAGSVWGFSENASKLFRPGGGWTSSSLVLKVETDFLKIHDRESSQ